ncbi:hypothetical protein TSUD_189120 [Trifolium subterraneum]|uniref:Uncharacterized protein n=1 Tax=Trifolium subterraneum TaxID=3900 RepID=A0A2Z6PQV6_TRISU|nr:hypothetical protein TSUD_189120 [Trifolium subterraneum]
MAKELHEINGNSEEAIPGDITSITSIDIEKEIIFKYENPKNTLCDMTNFPALPRVEIVELEEMMFALLSEASA